jgi:non-ribosomal peptide synthetase component E (peptide arylation enzyme)
MPINYKITESNAETGIVLERDATADEIAQMQADAQDAVSREKELQDKADAKAALLERLGITADEAALLLG